MGFFGELAACKTQALAVPAWLIGTAVRWVLWVMVAGLLPGVYRLLWFVIVGLVEWAAWRSTLSCLKDRLIPYQLAIVLGIVPVLASRILVTPYLLDPIRGYMPLNYPYRAPSVLIESAVQFLVLLWIWRVGYGALLRSRVLRACRTVPYDWRARAWNVTVAVAATYAFLLLGPFVYAVLYLLGPLVDNVPFFKDFFFGGLMGAASFLWFTLHADAFTDATCKA